ncbi:MAG: hypothetical protein K6G73_12315 [Marinilabiliaceae bacterium]|nr:hypothetical protein [Marinilabiliaceae bacterium]
MGEQLTYTPTTDTRNSLVSLRGGAKERQANQMAREARRAGMEVQNIAAYVANLFGGTTTGINYKTPKSIRGKFDRNEAEGKRYNDVKDVARTTILFNSQKDVQRAVAFMEKNYLNKSNGIDRYKKQDDPESGYKGNLFNISMKTRSGKTMTTEVQVLTKKMLYAKDAGAAKASLSKADIAKIRNEVGNGASVKMGRGHELYEKLRTAKGEKARKRIAKISRNFYSKFDS